MEKFTNSCNSGSKILYTRIEIYVEQSKGGIDIGVPGDLLNRNLTIN